MLSYITVRTDEDELNDSCVKATFLVTVDEKNKTKHFQLACAQSKRYDHIRWPTLTILPGKVVEDLVGEEAKAIVLPLQLRLLFNFFIANGL